MFLKLRHHSSREGSRKVPSGARWPRARGSSGVQILACIVLLGPSVTFFSSVHDSECPASGGNPNCSPSSRPANTESGKLSERSVGTALYNTTTRGSWCNDSDICQLKIPPFSEYEACTSPHDNILMRLD